MKYTKIKSIKKIPFKGTVYNLAVEGEETYTANGIVVHNCRSLLVPVLADEEFIVDKHLAIKPAEGFY